MAQFTLEKACKCMLFVCFSLLMRKSSRLAFNLLICFRPNVTLHLILSNSISERPNSNLVFFTFFFYLYSMALGCGINFLFKHMSPQCSKILKYPLFKFYHKPVILMKMVYIKCVMVLDWIFL